MTFHDCNIVYRFSLGDNVIAHPCVCYSKKFIDNNRYLDEIPEEDFKLWKRTINDYKFYICEEFLLHYRVHSNQITHKTAINSKSEVIPICVKEEFCKYCGFPKNKVRFNYCQKCNKLY